MGRDTGISWTDATWNPIRGCSRVSEGCRNCYAEHIAYRFSGAGQPYEGLVRIGADGERRAEWNGQIRFVEEHLLDPLRWKKPQRIFVNSMSDLFHENIATGWLDCILAVATIAPHHNYQILTKRAANMLSLMSGDRRRAVDDKIQWLLNHFPWFPKGKSWPRYTTQWPLPNVWLGVSVENQKASDERIPLLLQTPAAVRFISAEPLLGPVDLLELPSHYEGSNRPLLRLNAFTGEHECGRQSFGPQWGSLDWVIVGGESGPKARPMHPDWARSLRDQCKAAGVPFFFKQWGEWLPWQQDGGPSEWKSQTGRLMDRHAFPDFKDAEVRNWTDDCLHEGDDICVHQRVGTKAAGHLLDGVEHHEFPA